MRVLPLAGLSVIAAEAFLRERGIVRLPTEAAALVEHYSGNALALKLVAETIRDLFGGDVAGFLGEEMPIFDGIRTVLDEQFGRLSDLEQQILTWLAIERELVTLAVLQADLLDPPARWAVLEAVRNLRRRSLLETHANCFALQNVVTEFVTSRLVDEVRSTRVCPPGAGAL